MPLAVTILISLLPQIPSLITSITELIQRGRKTGELTPEEANSLTTMAQLIFTKYSSPAPPPPGVTPGPG